MKTDEAIARLEALNAIGRDLMAKATATGNLNVAVGVLREARELLRVEIALPAEAPDMDQNSFNALTDRLAQEHADRIVADRIARGELVPAKKKSSR